MAANDPAQTLDVCRPMARHDRLVMTQVDNEFIVYDEAAHAIHYLNRVSHAVWSLCDGTRTVAEVQAVTATHSGTHLHDGGVLLALRQLAEADLLINPAPVLDAGETQTRRSLLRRLGATATLPVVVSVSAPAAIMAASGCVPDGATCQNFEEEGPAFFDCCGTSTCLLTGNFGYLCRPDGCRPEGVFCNDEDLCCSLICIGVCG